MKLILQLICANLIISCGASESELDGKDLILVSIDTLRTDRLPFYGTERKTAGNPLQKWSLAWIAANGPQNARMVRRLIAGATAAC